MAQALSIIPSYLVVPSTPSISVASLAVDYGGDLEIVEVAEELNDVAKLKESATFDADIPNNTSNRWAVDQYGNAVPVLCQAHGYQLPEKSMVVNSYTESQYDVSFVRSQGWVEAFKALPLNNIGGFDPFRLNETFLDNNQLNDAAYTGTERGFYTPVVYYGGLNRFNEATSTFELTFADYRLWFHWAKILQECFFVAGYQMDCPFLKTPYGQRLGGYFVGGAKIYDGYFSKNRLKDKLQLPVSDVYGFRATKTANQVMTGLGDPAWWGGERIQFQNDSTGGNYDNASALGVGFFDTTNGEIKSYLGRWRYRVHLVITGQAAPVAVTMNIYTNILAGAFSEYATYTAFYDLGGNLLSENGRTLTVPGGTVTVVYDFDVVVDSAKSFRDMFFGFFGGTGAGLTVKAGSYIKGDGEIIVVSNEAGINETIYFPQSWLSPEVRAMEVLEAYCHLTNSKIYTDQARRTVGIYTEEDIMVYGEESEPYYFKTIEKDLAPAQVVGTFSSSLKETAAPEKYTLGFKETTDAYIESVSKSNPFDAEINLSEFADKTDPAKNIENRNALVEPSVERPFLEIKTSNPVSVPISVMAVLDNLVGETTLKTAPRACYFYGLVKQRVAPGGSVYKNFRRRAVGITTTQTVFAYATQFPSGEIVNASNVLIENDKTLVYDHNVPVTEPLKRYWVSRIRALYALNDIKITVLVASFNEFLLMNFRQLYRFKINGHDWKGRLSKKRTRVNDFRRVEVEATEEKEC